MPTAPPPNRRPRSRRWTPPRLRGRLPALLGALLLVLVSIGTAQAASGGPTLDPVSPQTPDSEVNVTGPQVGTTPDGEIDGYADIHTHLMSDEGFGGEIVCGKTYSRAGVADALQDCESHGENGSTALIENLTHQEGKGPFDTHDTTLWPTFEDAPKWSSMTHQQMYYKWVERSWRAGQRVMVADAVNNNVLCSLPTQVNRYGCDDMDTVRRQIQATKDLEQFIDEQYGGPGQGWFRIAYTADEVREYASQGKLAVILGVEVSTPFGCGVKLGVPQCTKSDIDRGLDELHDLGVRSMFLCHKFDNALCGVKMDEGAQGVIVNVGNFANTGQFWQVEQCAPGQLTDHEVAGGAIPAELARLFPTAVLPLYPEGPHCNKKGLTGLGEYALRAMMQRNMVVEIDHQSAKAAKRTMEILESERYPGVVSSHSWANEEFTERIYDLGGFIAQYGWTAKEAVAEGQEHAATRQKYDVGFGLGMDMNGFGGTPRPREDSGSNPITYPFTQPNGVTVDKQVSGQRVWDYNTDGVAHYGMVPDWLHDLRTTQGQAGADMVRDIWRGAESYADTFAATQGWSEGQDLTEGASASASSTEWSLWGAYRPEKAIDASMSSRWASRWGEGQWWQVDLGTSRPIAQVSIEWERAYAKEYEILVSGNGSDWTTAATVTGSDGGLDTTRVDTSARYVRIQSVQRATRYGISMHDVKITS